MSTISVTQKSRIPNILSNRNNILIVLAALALTLVVIFAASLTSPAAQAFDYNAYMLYRQGEWVFAPVSSAHAYQIFRRGEVVSTVTNAEAYQLYRQGEWVSVAIPGADLTSYHLSERSQVDPQAGLTQYLLSERTFVDPQAGLEIYRQSERTRIPVRFDPYQRSEWFGD